MKSQTLRITRTALGTALLMWATSALAQSGGRYTLSWNTVDGGGGNCASGKLSLSGTVGQPDAGFCTGSTYVHRGGFLPAFQKDVGPPLSMARSMGNLIFTWPNICTGFVLEGAQNVTGQWTTLGSGSINGGNYQLTVGALTPHRFFRLRKNCPS